MNTTLVECKSASEFEEAFSKKMFEFDSRSDATIYFSIFVILFSTISLLFGGKIISVVVVLMLATFAFVFSMQLIYEDDAKCALIYGVVGASTAGAALVSLCLLRCSKILFAFALGLIITISLFRTIPQINTKEVFLGNGISYYVCLGIIIILSFIVVSYKKFKYLKIIIACVIGSFGVVFGSSLLAKLTQPLIISMNVLLFVFGAFFQIKIYKKLKKPNLFVFKEKRQHTVVSV